MTGEEMLRELESKAWEQGAEAGRKRGPEEGREEGLEEGREEGARRMVRLAFEQRFGPMSLPLQEALGRVQSLGELDRLMAACIAETKSEVARVLDLGVH